MRILLLSYWYAPARHPRAFRWTSLAAYWARKGWSVDVVCSGGSGLPGEERIDGVRVFRAGGAITGAIRNRFGKSGRIDRPGDRGPGGQTRLLPEKHSTPPATAFLRWINDTLWRRVWWPDYACLWYFPALKKAAALLEKNRYDGLITTSDPFTGHLAGLSLHRRFPRLPWVVDIGDPFILQKTTPMNNLFLYDRLNHRVEKRVLEGARGVTVTSPFTLEEYREAFPESGTKITVAPPLLSTKGAEDKGPGPFPDDGKIRLVFVGTLYRKVRSPAFLLRLFERLLDSPVGEKLELHFFGNINDCEDFFEPYGSLLGGRIFLHGVVERSLALQATAAAGILVSIGNVTSHQLPSKVVEYAAAGKPILHLSPSERDSSARFFQDYPVWHLLREEEDSLSGDELARTIRFIEEARRPDRARIDRWLRAFRVEAVAKIYEDLLAH